MRLLQENAPQGSNLIPKEEEKHEAMLRFPLVPPLFINEQTAGNELVIFSFDSLQVKKRQNISSSEIASNSQSQTKIQQQRQQQQQQQQKDASCSI